MELSAIEIREKTAVLIVHAIGVCAAIYGVYVLMVTTARSDNDAVLIAGAVFSGGLLVSAFISAARTALAIDGWKATLRRADRAGVYLLIAAAYTPFAWIVVGGQDGFALLAFVWMAALAGVAVNFAPPKRFKKAPVVLFLLIGWALIGAADSLLTNLSKRSIYLIVSSAWSFSVGLMILRWDAAPFREAIWRVFVLFSAASIYAAIFIELTAR